MFVEMIERKELYDLERDINIELADLEKRGYEIVDIKYGCMTHGIPYNMQKEYSAMIIFKGSE